MEEGLVVEEGGPALIFPETLVSPSINNVPSQETPTQNDQTPSFSNQLFTIQKISSNPVAASAFVDEDRIVFIEKSTGHIYQKVFASSTPERISNITIPRISEALLGAGGKKLILQYFDDLGLQTFLAEIDVSGKKPLGGEFLPRDILDIVFEENSNRILYLSESSPGLFSLIEVLDGGDVRNIFSSPLRDLSINRVDLNNNIFLSTKPSVYSEGFLFKLDPLTQNFEKIVGNELGFNTNVSPDGQNQIMNINKDNVSISVLSINNDDVDNRHPIPVKTLVDKCVWSSINNHTVFCGVPSNINQPGLPDSWYKGIASFSDSLWEINISSQTTKRLVDLPGVGYQNIDITDLQLSDDERSFSFINKNDLSLWLVRINQ